MVQPDSEEKKIFRAEFFRQVKSRNQSAIARKLGISNDTVGNWGKDKAPLPDIWQAKLVAEYLGLPPGAVAFGEYGLSEQERGVIDVLRQFDSPPYETVVAMLQALPLPRKPIIPILAAPGSERKRVKVVQPEKKMAKINRRDELPRYFLTEQGLGLPVQGYSGLAAGVGKDLERCSELLYVREVQNLQGYTYARVAGQSMLETIRVGDRILLKHRWGERGLELPPRGSNPKNDMYRLRAEVPDDSICVVSIDEDFPTLKRIRYDVADGPNDWRLVIEADNPNEWKPVSIRKTQHVRFYAQFVGLLEME